MKVALIYPPACDPTAPYISVPVLTSYLRMHSIDVLPIDANVQACNYLLSWEHLQAQVSRARKRFRRLDTKPALSHVQCIEYAALGSVLPYMNEIPQRIGHACKVLRTGDADAFFDWRMYRKSASVVENALSIISAANFPDVFNFSSYKSPVSFLSGKKLNHDNPLLEFFSAAIIPQLKENQISLTGISIVFPGQLQAAYSLAAFIKDKLPHIHVTAGGPAITQLLLRLSEEEQAEAIVPFDSVILFEGEHALHELVLKIQSGVAPKGIITGSRSTDLKVLGAPDFDGMLAAGYLAPEIVLPYDATRGCYWGKCAFCHYGLSEAGTANYRERAVEGIVDDLLKLSKKYRTRIFYLSEDTISPATLKAVAHGIEGSGAHIKWATDCRPEKSLSLETCRALKRGGALCMTLGIESGSTRILKLMQKGIRTNTMGEVISNLHDSGIATEVMCFTDFATENYHEAMETLQFLEDNLNHISLFMCGEFELMPGSLVALNPGKFGLRSTWTIESEGHLINTIFYSLSREYKSEAEKHRLDKKIASLSTRFVMSRYPWAGSLSTAHTFLWFHRFGADIFRSGVFPEPGGSDAQKKRVRMRYNLERLTRKVQENEHEIWHSLIYVNKNITRNEYMKLASYVKPTMPLRV